MKIYTKRGDQGQTELFGGIKISKDHVRIDAYGTIDELNAALGLAITDSTLGEMLIKRLKHLQEDLFCLGAELATPINKKTLSKVISESDVLLLETEIDEMEKELLPLKTFILPGGCSGAAKLHLTRTICRRAERCLVRLHQIEPLRYEILKFINRLSDYFFVCARYVNYLSGVKDIPWGRP